MKLKFTGVVALAATFLLAPNMLYAENIVINSDKPVVIDQPLVGQSISITAPSITLGPNAVLSTPGNLTIGSPGATIPGPQITSPFTGHTGPVIFSHIEPVSDIAFTQRSLAMNMPINPVVPGKINPISIETSREMMLPQHQSASQNPQIIQAQKETASAARQISQQPQMISIHPEIFSPGATMNMEASITSVAADGSVQLQ